MSQDATDPTPYDTPLTFRTEVRPYLYLASAGLTLLGLLFIGFALSRDTGVTGILITAVGVAMLYFAWVNFWATQAGYPHLVLHGHRLTVQSSEAFRRDLDLGALGETSIVILTGAKASTRYYLCFMPLPGKLPPQNRIVAERLAPFAETILLNGYVNSVPRAKEIERVVNERRLETRREIVLPPIALDRQRAARQRLIATAVIFGLIFAALVAWRWLA